MRLEEQQHQGQEHDAQARSEIAVIEAFERSGAQAFYCQPTYHNPTGSVLAAERRSAVPEAASAVGAFVIEDDVARWLAHGQTRPPRPLLAQDQDGRVVYVTALTKVASPSLRVGAVIARGPVAHRISGVATVEDRHQRFGERGGLQVSPNGQLLAVTAADGDESLGDRAASLLRVPSGIMSATAARIAASCCATIAASVGDMAASA